MIYLPPYLGWRGYIIKASANCFIDIDRRIQNLGNRQAKINREKDDISRKIIFNSPFYKKRNKTEAKFRKFSRFLSADEIEKYGSDIWREAHSGHISEIL